MVVIAFYSESGVWDFPCSCLTLQGGSMQLADYIAIVWRHKWVAILTVLVTMIVVNPASFGKRSEQAVDLARCFLEPITGETLSI
jgi:hypothetical protein